jgi:hypothetical protein
MLLLEKRNSAKAMQDVKLFSGAIFLFSILVTIGFFQSLKQERIETIHTAKALEFAAVDEDVPLEKIPEEKIKMASTSLHVSSSMEFSRHAVCLFTILFPKKIDFDIPHTSDPVPLFKFCGVLLTRVISPNAP